MTIIELIDILKDEDPHAEVFVEEVYQGCLRMPIKADYVDPVEGGIVISSREI